MRRFPNILDFGFWIYRTHRGPNGDVCGRGFTLPHALVLSGHCSRADSLTPVLKEAGSKQAVQPTSNSTGRPRMCALFFLLVQTMPWCQQWPSCVSGVPIVHAPGGRRRIENAGFTFVPRKLLVVVTSTYKLVAVGPCHSYQ